MFLLHGNTDKYVGTDHLQILLFQRDPRYSGSSWLHKPHPFDSGTSFVKAAVVSHDGDTWGLRCESQCAVSRPSSGAPGISEQEAETWWTSAVAAIRSLPSDSAARGITGVGLSGQMQAVVLLDSAGRPLRPALLYSDSRAANEAAELEVRSCSAASITTRAHVAHSRPAVWAHALLSWMKLLMHGTGCAGKVWGRRAEGAHAELEGCGQRAA